MSQFDLLMPKLGESVQEATILKWLVKEGDTVEEDQELLEIGTDKVDSPIPSPVAGKVVKILYEQNALVPVGKIIAHIALEGSEVVATAATSEPEDKKLNVKAETEHVPAGDFKNSGRFYSPVVRAVAAQENISPDELEKIPGSGHNGRVQKRDVLNFLENRGGAKVTEKVQAAPVQTAAAQTETVKTEKPKVSVSVSAGDEIIEMDRMRKLIAEHMVHSKHTAAHVTNMIEVDVTDIVRWREKIKDDFQKREKVKITYLPVFLEAIARALKEFPMINAAVDGDRIILRKAINLGVAVALPTNNLIVPVIKNADQLNLLGLTMELNRLADAARNNKLKPDDIAGGTFSISNFGTFRNVMGTPVISQPQVAILATGTVEKKPAVVETPHGDIIAIRHKMFLSLTYDHRIIDGALGGSFLRRLGDILESFDTTRTI